MFITFEGIEGCGKTTQAKLLYNYLSDKGYEVILTREPGGTETAEKIREILLKKTKEKFPPFSELSLYVAARGFHVENLIKPKLKEGKIVICDRFSDSTVAYQGFGRGLPLNLVKEMDKEARGGIKPNLTFLIDIPVEESLKRLKRKRRDRIEEENLSFHKKVREGFLKIAQEEKERIKVIDGRKGIAEIFKEVVEEVEKRLNR